ncbi:MAG: glutamate synthase subunit beta [Chloroflexi bacterium]|nr:glutamate synthase subunit beta [Chloroflexota bacterium]
MAKPTGFIEFVRVIPERRPVQERKADYREFYRRWTDKQAREQGARCMDCAVPFCHMGCPLGNLIPDFNHQVYLGDWQQALKVLLSTNNFPEFTGRICPAPCEASCVLSINSDPVTIEYIEKEISERGFERGWIKAEPPSQRTDKKVAVVGSGPAGLAAAQQLNRAGHSVTVFERDDYIGGLLMLGIPDFKLSKDVVRRRVDLMIQEGITFRTGINVGVNYSVDELRSQFDAVCLTGGSTHARDLPVPGRELSGIHLAMDYLPQQNRIQAGETIAPEQRITAEGKRVVILGGGDTGADCLGTAHRQGAELVSQYELLPEPPKERGRDNPWPQWPNILRLSGAHEEGGIRDYDILTKSFSGSNGRVERLHAVRVEWTAGENGRYNMEEVPGSEFEVETDLVLLAMGFLHPQHEGMLTQLGVELDARGNVKIDKDRMTNIPGIFAGGDMARGQSLVVWAIAEGREAARSMDLYLMGHTQLPRSLPAK